MAMACNAFDDSSNLSLSIGKRTKASGEALMAKLPAELKKKAHFFTDKFAAYYEIISW